MGGLYLRRYVRGLVLVNSSDASLPYVVPGAMKRARFSGGGQVASDGTLPAMSLIYDTDVAAGSLSVPAHSAVILRDPRGAPSEGEEPGATPPVDGGASASGAGGARAAGGTGNAAAGAASSLGGATVATGGGISSGAGASGGGASGADAGAERGRPKAASDSGGCGCRVVALHERSGGAALALLLLGLCTRRRRV